MPDLHSVLLLAHLLGLALGLGCATAKWVLLLRCRAEPGFLPAYRAAARPLTRLIIVGMTLLTVSGIAWLLTGSQLTSRLAVKLTLVAAIWVLGPVIDNAVEPRFWKLAAAPGESASPAFLRIQNRYLLFETVATGLFYVIVVMWVLM
jgi:hypothetical protein